MQDLINSIQQLQVKFNELESNFGKWKDNTGTVVVEKVIEVIKEVPVEVIKEVEKVVAPDTSELNAKVLDLTGKLDAVNSAVVGLTSVAPVVEKAVEAVAEAVVAAVENPEPTPAVDAFVATPEASELVVNVEPAVEPTEG